MKRAELIDYSHLTALQISQGFSLLPAWLKSYKLSMRGIQNSIDIRIIETIELYDIAVCKCVLEHMKKGKSQYINCGKLRLKMDFCKLVFLTSRPEPRITIGIS